ncbi:MAG TPA: metallophosphoesterase, partial [Candidatus Limnocylindria bacterium]|nr:metallophosphoesterase [Candidatus Limnocylindria bacterium]
MLMRSPRSRTLALASMVALLAGLLAYLAFGRGEAVSPGVELPSRLPSIPVRTQPPSGAPTASGTPLPATEVLLAVGDVGSCDDRADDAVAQLASRLPGLIALMGDIAYERGTPEQFDQCFDPSWGPMRERLRPVPGNHEYLTDGAAGYFDYFGPSVGEPPRGWYSYDLGAWHVVALNSNCNEVACGTGSPQVEWLREDLAAHPSDCLLASFHHPRWSSGRLGSSAR